MAFPAVTVEIAFSNYSASTTVVESTEDEFTETFTDEFDSSTVTYESATILILDDPVTGALDTGVLGGDVWTDVTAYVEPGFSSRRGASRAEPIMRYDAGTCSLTLDNSTRRFDPTNLSGPYVVDGETQITPMRPVRIRATWDGVTYDVFRGFADEWAINWFGPGYSTCTLTATDATKVLANIDRDALETPIGEGETTGQRVNRVLDTVLWPTEDRLVSTGNSTVQATTHDRSAWEELVQVGDAELGEIYVDAAGRVVFRNRHATITDNRSTYSQGTFGDGVGELPFKDTAISYDDNGLANIVRISRTGGTQQTAQDEASKSRNLWHTFTRTDLILDTDTETESYAQFLLSQAKDPELRFTTLTVTPHDDETALYPQVLGRQIGDRITITRRPPGGGTITRDVFLRGISHEVTVNNWATTFVLQSASKWGSYLILDDPVHGALDSYALAH